MERSFARSAAPTVVLFAVVTTATMAGLFTGFDGLATAARLRLPLDVVAWMSEPFVLAGSVGVTALLVAAIALLLLGRRRPGAAAAFALAYALANVVELALKFFYAHPNPPHLGQGGASPVPDLLLLHLLTDANIGLLPRQVLLDSYPSGHTARAVLICLALAAAWPARRFRVLLSVFVVLLMLALILGGSHWPSDVLGGAALGWACAAIAAAAAPSRSPDPPGHRVFAAVYDRCMRSFERG